MEFNSTLVDQGVRLEVHGGMARPALTSSFANRLENTQDEVENSAVIESALDSQAKKKQLIAKVLANLPAKLQHPGKQVIAWILNKNRSTSNDTTRLGVTRLTSTITSLLQSPHKLVDGELELLKDLLFTDPEPTIQSLIHPQKILHATQKLNPSSSAFGKPSAGHRPRTAKKLTKPAASPRKSLAMPEASILQRKPRLPAETIARLKRLLN